MTVQTKDVQAASKSIENLLEKSGIADSRSEQEGGDNVYIFSIDSQKINELYTGIIAFAGIKEKSLPKDLPEGKITVRIAITGN